MAAALILNFCFFLAEVVWQFYWCWLSCDAESCLPCPELEPSIPGSSAEPASQVNVCVFFQKVDASHNGQCQLAQKN